MTRIPPRERQDNLGPIDRILGRLCPKADRLDDKIELLVEEEEAWIQFGRRVLEELVYGRPICRPELPPWKRPSRTPKEVERALKACRRRLAILQETILPHKEARDRLICLLRQPAEPQPKKETQHLQYPEDPRPHHD